MSRPLDGVRVLDLGQIYQGGYSGLLLSFLGADVVKVEPPWGENVRTRSDDGKPPQYQFLNITKRGITLNLKSEEGKATLKDLVAEADVLLENFAKGKMEELGVGYETLREVNPELIYAHGSGYGDDGPYAEYPAMDLTVQAMSGVMNATGYADQPPVKAGPAICDFMGALHLVVGIVSSLYERERTDEGQYVEVGMFDTMFPTLASPVSSLVDQNDAPPRTGNKHSGLAIAPYNTYEVEDGYVAIICVAERHWENLTEVMGKPELAEMEKYSSKARRAQHIDEVDGYIEEWLEGKTKEEVMEILLETNVPSAPVKTVEEIIEDPHLKHRNMIEYLPNQTDGRKEMPVPGMPIKFSGAEEPEIERAPFLGEHTDEILAEMTDYSREEIEELKENNAV